MFLHDKIASSLSLKWIKKDVILRRMSQKITPLAALHLGIE
jgi:hypothetical protein